MSKRYTPRAQPESPARGTVDELDTRYALLGPLVQALRRTAGVSQTTAAAACGLSQAHWSRVETGTAALDQSQLCIFDRLLGLPPGASDAHLTASLRLFVALGSTLGASTVAEALRVHGPHGTKAACRLAVELHLYRWAQAEAAADAAGAGVELTDDSEGDALAAEYDADL